MTAYPTNKYKIQSIYKLESLYSGLQNQPKSDYYRNLLLTEYPETDYAKLLVNPDYYKEIQARQSEALNLYAETFRAFNNAQFYMVLNNADIARTKYSADTSLMPKFEYLRALSLGKIEVEDSLVVALQGIVKKYPKSSVKPLAVNLLNYLSARKGIKGGTLVPGDTDHHGGAGTEDLCSPSVVGPFLRAPGRRQQNGCECPEDQDRRLQHQILQHR